MENTPCLHHTTALMNCVSACSPPPSMLQVMTFLPLVVELLVRTILVARGLGIKLDLCIPEYCENLPLCLEMAE